MNESLMDVFKRQHPHWFKESDFRQAADEMTHDWLSKNCLFYHV